MAKEKHASVFFDRESKKFKGIDIQILKQLEDTYDGIDVNKELNKMGLWLLSDKGKRRAGNIGFILHWLNNATPMPPTVTEKHELMQSKSPLGLAVREYLLGLWKDKEHLLNFNTTKAKS